MPQKLLTLFFILIGSSLSTFGQFMQKPLEKPLIDTNAKKRNIISIDEGSKKALEQSKKYLKDPNSLKKEFNSKGDVYLKKIGLSTSKTSQRRLKSKVKNKFKSKDEYLGVKILEKIGSYGGSKMETIEQLHVVKYVEDEKINPYLQFIYCFDPKQSQIIYVPKEEANKYLICHGPYEKYVNKLLIEKGEFNMGGKQGRWEEFDRNYNLINKEYFNNGFKKESIISYFDDKKTKIKEIIPVRFGEMTGTYFSFYESGNLESTGEIEDGIRIGRWLEFYEYGRNGKLRREWKYGNDKFDPSEPILIQEREQQ